jgi:transposase-like protein
MPRSGPRRITKYTREFKLAAVRLSQVSGLQVQAVADTCQVRVALPRRYHTDTTRRLPVVGVDYPVADLDRSQGFPATTSA